MDQVSHQHKLSPWNTVLLQKLTVTQVSKKFLVLYATWRCITVIARAPHWSLSCSRWIHSNLITLSSLNKQSCPPIPNISYIPLSPAAAMWIPPFSFFLWPGSLNLWGSRTRPSKPSNTGNVRTVFPDDKSHRMMTLSRPQLAESTKEPDCNYAAISYSAQ